MRLRSFVSYLVATAVAGALASPALAQQDFSTGLRAKFRGVDKVAASLDSGGTARVIVVLAPGAGQSAWKTTFDTGARLRALKAATRSVQDKVLTEGLGIAASQEGARRVRRYDTFPMLAVDVDKAALERLAARADVESIQADEAVPLVLDGSTVTIGAPTVWTAGSEGAGYAVAVLDTGVQVDHPFYADRLIGEACYSGGGSTTNSLCPNGQASQTGSGAGAACTTSGSCYHGTHVAGIAVGHHPSSGSPEAGVAPAASLVAVQVFSKSGSNVSAWFSDIIAGMEWVNTHHVGGTWGSVKVASVNLSLGGGLYSSTCDSSLSAFKASVDKLRANGIATVVAAGNDGVVGQVSAPSCVSTVVTVSSSDRSNARSSFSNIADVTDLYAPGSSIYSSVTGSSYGTASGTSMATPHVAGAFALLRSASPTSTVSEIEAALKTTGTPITAGSYTKQMIRVDLAANALGSTPNPNPTPAMTVTPATGWSVSMSKKNVLSATSTGYAVTGANGTVTFTAGAASGSLPSWLSVSPSSGSADGTAATVTFSINAAAAKALAAGTYTATVAFKATNGTGDTTRTVTLTRAKKK